MAAVCSVANQARACYQIKNDGAGVLVWLTKYNGDYMQRSLVDTFTLTFLNLSFNYWLRPTGLDVISTSIKFQRPNHTLRSIINRETWLINHYWIIGSHFVQVHIYLIGQSD